MKDVLVFLKESPDLAYITLIVLILVVERWLGRTLKVNEASILDVLLARVLRIPLSNPQQPPVNPEKKEE